MNRLQTSYDTTNIGLRVLCTLIFSYLIYIPVFSQVASYTFSQEAGTYTEISGGTVYGSAGSSDQLFVDPALPAGGTLKTGVGLPIGFDFVYNGSISDRIGLNINGWVSFGSSSLSPAVDMTSSNYYTPLSTTQALMPAELNHRLAALGLNLQGQTGSSLRMETLGIAPNRTCVIQWKGFRYENTTGVSYNFQIRLEETSNRVILAYGSFTNNSILYNAQVGLGGIRSDYFNNLQTTPNWDYITPGTLNTASCQLQEAIKPTNGQTLIWTPPAFTLPPVQAVITSPTNGQTGLQIDTVLNWKSCDVKVTGYKLWLGTDNPPTNRINGLDIGNVATYDPIPDLAVDTTYYWQVVPYNQNGDAADCPIWSFKTWSFVDVNATFPGVLSGVIYNGIVGYLEWGDYDNNGLLDVLIAGGTSGPIVSRIYSNNGDNTFTNINAAITGVSTSVTKWGDYDNDGDLDVAIVGTPGSGYIAKIFRNDGDGVFVDIQANLDTPYKNSLYWGDYDNDGFIDLLYHGMDGTPRLYRNNANDTFTRITPSVWISGLNYNGFVSWCDFNNDGLLDVIGGNGGNPILLRNDGGNNFTSINNPIIAGYETRLDWGDYDNDGDMDLAICSINAAGNEKYSKIYRNDGNCIFTDINANLTPASSGSIDWGDYDNDGDLDLLVTGGVNKLYRNDGNGVFIDIGIPIPAGSSSKAVFCDYNNDGKIDILYNAGTGYHTSVLILYKNVASTTNLLPTAPTLSFCPTSGDLIVSGVTDDTTPTAALTYDLRVSSTPGGIDVVSPMTDLATGYRRVVAFGRKIPRIDLKPSHTYYAAVQAIDNSYAGSPFSPEISFTTPPLQIVYPNGGESLVSGTTSYVRWISNSVKQLYIKLSVDNGANWIGVAAGAVQSGQQIFYYTVPSAISTQCLIKIIWVKDDTYNDTSDLTFSITSATSAPRITVSVPNAANLYYPPGFPLNITWTSANLASVSLDYTTNNGLTWNTIIENIPATPASYAWSVPDSVTNTARIRIRKADDTGCYDISDNTFTICKITVLTPHGGEVLTADYSGQTTQTITWSAPCVSNLILYYSTNNGSSWTSLGTFAGNLGHYSWTLPAVESSSCRIKASHANASFISGMCNAVFTIRVPVKFINANGGGFVNNNANYTLRWKRLDLDPAKQVFLEFSPDNTNWTRINPTALPVTSNQLTFFLALGSATQVWFRMLESDTNRIVAKSATAMTVTEKQLQITLPQTGDTLAIDSYTTILWNADACTSLNISYTTDFGNTWLSIATNIPSTQHSYVWHVPNTASSQCRIKLQDTTHSYMNIESAGEFTIQPNNFIASFYAANTTGYSDLVVQFTDQSIGYISSWAWDFNNDGITDSNLQNPTWTYRQSGFYTVKLTISDGLTNISIARTNYIYVQPMVADFMVTESIGYCPLTAQFTDQTESDLTQWQWDFNADGIVDADYQNPFWTFLFPGVYTVTQTVSNGLDSDTEIKTNYLTVTLDPLHTIYVPTDHLTIQAAINASVDGDYIIVADGIYYENLVINGKNITLGSYYFVDGDTTHISNTIIDGGNAINPDQASTLTILPSSSRTITTPHIVGFTIRNGAGRRIIQNIGGNTIEKRVGGGIYIKQANPVFSYNKIESNDADDEGGGSYAFQSLPNLGGTVNAALGKVNPGGNSFRNNHADIGADLYIQGITTRDEVKLENCSFEVYCPADTTVSNYWANSSSPLSFSGCNGTEAAITADIYVASNGSDSANTGLSYASPFKTIDHALSRVYATENNPLVIHIAAGTYSPSLTGERFPLQMVKYVSLLGAGQEETFLDAEANVDSPKRVINLDNLAGVSIANLTLMGGFVTLTKNYNGGGIGIINSSLNLHHAMLTGNSSAGDGAGVYAYNSTVQIDSISAEYNAALGSGGGIYASGTHLNLSNSSILNNTVNKNGAGIFADNGKIKILNCDIQNNQATGPQSKGGGLSISTTDSTSIVNSIIKSNNADNGAGIYLQSNTNLTLDRNKVLNNLADFNGGALFINTTTGIVTNSLIANNTASQRGGGLYCYSSPQLTNNTIVNNKANIQGGGMYLNTGSPFQTNSIYWGNVSGSDNTLNQIYIYTESAEPVFTYSDIQGGSSGFATASGVSYSGTYTDNLNTDPLFVNPSSGAGYTHNALTPDYSLQDTSPCIDTGDPATTLFPFDLIGNPRIDNNCIDIGAYEHVHYFGAIAEVSPANLDFGRINLSAQAKTLQISIRNTGNLSLCISGIAFEQPTTVFTWTFTQIMQPIAPGQTVTLDVSFDPTSIGVNNAMLLIANNSFIHPTISIPLTGTGIDASTSTPGNVQVNIVGGDVHLSWNPVLADGEGDPYTPGGYIILYSENADVVTNNYFYLGFATETSFHHDGVALYRSKMFYRVIAVDAITRQTLSSMQPFLDRSERLTWGALRAAILHQQNAAKRE